MISAAVQFLFCMVVFTVVERVSPSASPHKWWRRSLFFDICGWLVLPLAVSSGISSAVVLSNWIGALLSVGNSFASYGQFRAMVASVSIPVQFILAFLLMDFSSYWIHRAYHRFPFLWSFHVLHHTSEQLDWLSTLRLHPISQMINTFLMAFGLLLAGFSVQSIVAGNIIIGLSAVVVHANVLWTFGPLRHLFVSPRFHHWHHARQNDSALNHAENYGAVLSIWDGLFGTASRSAAHTPAQYGANEEFGSNLWATLLFPLRFLRRSRRNERPDD